MSLSATTGTSLIPTITRLSRDSPRIAINSNDKNYNPNVTVLEWLHNKQEYCGKVAAFWRLGYLPRIINEPRAESRKCGL